MITFESEEQDLIGRWKAVDGKVRGDATTTRIETLIEDQLEKIGTDPTGWDTLYRDPRDGRYWELTFPESSLHGGGPPRLTNLSNDQVRDKYHIAIGKTE